MNEQELFERSVGLGLRAAKVVLERGEGVAGIDRLIWQTEHPMRLAQGIEAGTATTVGRGPQDESPVAESDAPLQCRELDREQ